MPACLTCLFVSMCVCFLRPKTGGRRVPQCQRACVRVLPRRKNRSETRTTHNKKIKLKHTHTRRCVYNLHHKRQTTDRRTRRHGILLLTSAPRTCANTHAQTRIVYTNPHTHTGTHTAHTHTHARKCRKFTAREFFACARGLQLHTRTLTRVRGAPAQFGGKLHSFDNVQLIIAQHQQHSSGDSSDGSIAASAATAAK